MLWSLGFLVTFLFGGLTGVIIASPALDFHVTDTYFIVAHFHYTVFGTVVFAMFAGFYFWWPKLTGRMLDERLGKIHFWMLFIGFHTTFLIQHLLGIEGMAASLCRLPAAGGLPAGQRHLDRRRCPPRDLDPAVPLQHLENLALRPARRDRRPLGLRRVPGVGHLLPAAAPQLQPHSADPLRAPRVRPAPSRGRPTSRPPGRPRNAGAGQRPGR